MVRKIEWQVRGINEEDVASIVEVLRHGKIHVTELARQINRSDAWVRWVANGMIDAGRGKELDGLVSYRRGSSRIEIPYVESLKTNRKLATEKQKPDVPHGCRYCGLLGQLVGQSKGRQRTVCDSCMVDADLQQRDPDHTRSWRDDARWRSIVAKAHQATGGCVICGSSRAASRDGRYCDWRHDPVMLDPGELDALLDRYSAAPSRWNTFGNPVR
jgi:hypothetical protein